jgi:hypothetical protein
LHPLGEFAKFKSREEGRYLLCLRNLLRNK